LSKTSVARPSRKDTEAERARMHRILKEAEERYRFELLSVDERELLCDRIVALKTGLAATA
jgi:hypothetical protein